MHGVKPPLPHIP